MMSAVPKTLKPIRFTPIGGQTIRQVTKFRDNYKIKTNQKREESIYDLSKDRL